MKREKRAKTCECGLLTLYRELAAEYEVLNGDYQNQAEELESVREQCEEALRGVEGAKPWKEPATLVRQCLDAWAEDRALAKSAGDAIGEMKNSGSFTERCVIASEWATGADPQTTTGAPVPVTPTRTHGEPCTCDHCRKVRADGLPL